MKIKTSELTGPALDWAVAKCEDRLAHIKLDKFKQWQDLCGPTMLVETMRVYVASKLGDVVEVPEGLK